MMALENANHARGAATVAKVATVQPPRDPTVATIARIAGLFAKNTLSAGQAESAAATSFEDQFIHIEERAAILEYDGGFARAEAEWLARNEPL